MGLVDSERKDQIKVKKKRTYNLQRSNNISGLLFISPFYIIFAIFGLFPLVFTIVLSFYRWSMLGEREFVGIENYKLLFTNDPLFWLSVGNTFKIWFMSTVPQLILALILAFVLNMAFLKGKGIFRLAVFMPNITSVVAVAIVFSSMFGTNYGVINYFLELIGLNPIDWSGTRLGTQVAISAMIMWRWVGYNTIIYLAGLQGISRDLYEAATIDGATTRQQFLYITIPLMRPIILFTVILSTIGGMQIFTEPMLFGKGSVNQGLTMTLYLYEEAFTRYSFGYAAAVAWILFFIIILFSLVNMFLTRIIRS